MAQPKDRRLLTEGKGEALYVPKDDLAPAITAALAADDTVTDAASAAVSTDLAGRDIVEGNDRRMPRVVDTEIGLRWLVRAGRFTPLAVDDDGSVYIGRLDAATLAYLKSTLNTEALDILARSRTGGDEYYPWRVRVEGTKLAPLAVRHDGAVDFARLTPEALAYLASNLSVEPPEAAEVTAETPTTAWTPEAKTGTLHATHQPTGRRIQVDTAVSDVSTTNRDLLWTKDGVQLHRRHPSEPNYLAITNKTKMSMWGSSTASGFNSSMSAVATSLGVATYFNGGAGGNRTSQILARLGVRPLTVNAVTLAASGATTVVSQNVATTGFIGAFSYHGHFEGFESITGTLAVAGSNPPAGTPLTFTRDAAGSAATIPAGAQFIPTKGHEFRDCVAVLNIGKNSLSDAPEDWKQTFRDTVEAYEWMRSVTKWVAVMGHFVNSNAVPGGPSQAGIIAYNAALAEHFGDRYIDLSGYLTGSRVWIDSGVTPTAGDLAQQANGLKPDSLSSDDLHQNTAGYVAAANYLIKPKLLELGWY